MNKVVILAAALSFSTSVALADGPVVSDDGQVTVSTQSAATAGAVSGAAVMGGMALLVVVAAAGGNGT